MADPVQAAADAAGVTVRRTPEAEAHESRLDAVLDLGGFANPKLAHARARIARILEGAQFGGARRIEDALKDAAMPELAREYTNLFAQYHLFRHRRSRWNPFFGLSDFDAARMFEARMYSICDRSTGRFGNWWVK